MKNIYIAVGIVFALVVGVLVGYTIHPTTTPANHIAGAVADTNSSQRIASCVLDMSTTTPTTATTTGTSCMFNGDSKDRIITSIDYYISNLGSATTAVASTTWQMGTSTGIYTPGASYVLNTTIATTTGNGAIGGVLFVSTTTPGNTGTYSYRVWNAGTYLNLLQNSVSTWVATIKVNYFSNN
jgi:hypothetical protein